MRALVSGEMRRQDEQCCCNAVAPCSTSVIIIYVRTYLSACAHWGRRWRTSSQAIVLIYRCSYRGSGQKVLRMAIKPSDAPVGQEAAAGSLFGGASRLGRVREGVDLAAPALDVEPDSETGREIEG